jgi:hypothetical protein
MDPVPWANDAYGLARDRSKPSGPGKDAEHRLNAVRRKGESADLVGDLLEPTTKVAELTGENARLKGDPERATAPPEVESRDGMYFRKDGAGPYCTACRDERGKMNRVTEPPPALRKLGGWRCPTCHAKYGV